MNKKHLRELKLLIKNLYYWVDFIVTVKFIFFKNYQRLRFEYSTSCLSYRSKKLKQVLAKELLNRLSDERRQKDWIKTKLNNS